MRHLALAAVALVVLVGPIRAEDVPLDKVPKPVMETVNKRFPKAEAKKASKATAEGKTEFEITLKQDGKNIDVTVTAGGTITTIEKEVAFKDLPKPVAETFEKKYPKATYTIIEQVITVKDGKETTEYYEAILVTAEKKTFEAEVLPDGKFKGETEKKEKNVVLFVGGDDDKNKKSKKGEKGDDEDDDKGKSKKSDNDDKRSKDLPKSVAESVKSKFPGGKVVGVTKDGKGDKATYEVELRYKSGTLEVILSAKGDVVEVELKGKDSDEDDKKGKKGDDDKNEKGRKSDDDKNEKGKKGDDDKKGEKAKSSGFQGEQKGQHEDKDDKKSKKGDDDKNEKNKNKKDEK